MFWFSRKITIPVISLDGVISSNSELSFKKVNKLLKTAFSVSNVKTVAISINSPGGSPVQSELIYRRIRSLAKEHNVTILTFIQDLGASGGYYIACAGDEIYALNSSIVGSIGVVSGGFGLHEFIKNYGIERRIYTHGKNKSILDPFMPEKQSDVKILLDVSKDVYDNFVGHVKKCRGNKLAKDETLFTGQFWSGMKAADLGLIDGIGDIYSILHSKYGKNIQIKYIQENQGILSFLKSILGFEIGIKSVFNTAIQKVIEYTTYSRYGL